jgi:hypothetical protein
VADTERLLAGLPARRGYRSHVSVGRMLILPFRLMPVLWNVMRSFRGPAR